MGFREIKAWADLRDVRLLPWQLDAIISLDIKRRALAAEAADGPKDEVSSRPLNSSLFDALFPNRNAK